MPVDTRRPRNIPAALLLAAVVVCAGLYVWRLGDGPVYLGGDEAHFAVHGAAIARDGRNLGGMRLPLFVNLWDPRGDQQAGDLKSRWYQPLLFYITALELRLAPLNEVTLRLPIALISGGLIPLLTYCVGLRLLNAQPLAIVAALTVALSPTMLILGRQALDYVLPLPFVLGWLWSVLAYCDGGRIRSAIGAGLLLGIGCYSYIAAWIFMPICLAVTWVVFLGSKRPDALRAAAVATAAFTVPLLPLVPWLLAHPEMLQDTMSRYQVPSAGDTTRVSVELQQLLDSAAWARRSRTYLSFFDPRVLFVEGGPIPTTSLGRSGVVLLPVAVLLPAGLYALASGRHRRVAAVLMVAGFFLSPVPAAFAAEPAMVQRALSFVIFAAFIAAAGAGAIARLPHAIHRPVFAAVAAIAVVQFAYVYRDYFTHYQLRSAFYYDPVAFPHVATELLGADGGPAVYFSRDLDDAGSKWRFYLIKYGREELLSRTYYVNPADPALMDAPIGSLLVTYPSTQVVTALHDSGAWRTRTQIFDIDNRPAATVLERIPR